jgi:hypothetical protein
MRAQTSRAGAVLMDVATHLPGRGTTEPLEFYISYP